MKKSDITKRAGDIFASYKSHKYQMGTDASIKGMDLLRWKAERVKNVGFEQSKGNLFEYIEAAKLQRNMGNKAGRSFDKTPLTDAGKRMDGWGENTAPDDFRFSYNKRIIGHGQAKFNNDPHKAAVNLANPKYTGMQRLVPIDQIPYVKDQLNQMVAKGEISKSACEDAVKNLQCNGAMDPSSGITSGGTTTNEIYSLCGKDGKVSLDAIEKYAKVFEYRQYGTEIAATTVAGVSSNAIMAGVVSGVQNFSAVLNNEKSLENALLEVGANATKSGVRGGMVGAMGASMRIAGVRNNIPIIKDATASTIIAGSVIDSGASIYAYAKGEISGQNLKEELLDTTVKSTTTIFLSKCLGTVIKTANPCVPVIIYSIASQLVTSSREIINKARLNAEEYRRVADFLNDAIKVMQCYHAEMNQYLESYQEEKQEMFRLLLDGFCFNPETGEGYEKSVAVIVNFAKKANMQLQHTDYNEFCKAMTSNDAFVLK